jgi:hypothetical protein
MTQPKIARPSRRRALKTLAFATGGAVSLPLMSTLSACSPEIKQELSPFMDLIEDVSEMIIPQTDTPGAVAASVPAYIEALVGTHYTPEEREAFKTGLKVFDEMAHLKSASRFLAASDAAKTLILEELDRDGAAIWQQLKQAVAFGYYTSEAAAEELQYDPIPGQYDGDADLSAVGRAWLTTGI